MNKPVPYTLYKGITILYNDKYQGYAIYLRGLNRKSNFFKDIQTAKNLIDEKYT